MGKLNLGVCADIFLQEKTGIGKYHFNLIKALFSLYKDRVSLYFFSRNHFLPSKLGLNGLVVSEPSPFFRKYPTTLWLRYRLPNLISRSKISVFFSGLPIIPLKRNPKLKVISTVYDLNIYICPETMKFSTRIGYKFLFKRSIMDADYVLAISNGTANKLHKYLGKKADVVIEPAISQEFLYKCGKYSTMELPIKGNFILFVSTIEPRKNVENLVEAFLELRKANKLSDFSLLLVGRPGWKIKKSLWQKIKKSNFIKHLGYVDDEVLCSLYRRAAFLIFPSIYEGFGIPILEARSLNCCVVATDIPEHREAGGNCILYFWPPTKEGIKKILLEVVSGKRFCKNQCLAEGIKTWDEQATKFINFLNSLEA